MELGEDGVVELVADLGAEPFVESGGGEVVFDGGFDVVDLEVAEGAAAGLACAADEVEVGAAVASAGGDDDALSGSVRTRAGP